MRSRSLTYLIAMIAFALSTAPIRLSAQAPDGQARYVVIRLKSLGGMSSAAQGLNSREWVAGDAELTGDATEHAVLWRNGKITDLGTLGGLNSFAGPVNEHGLVAGSAQTAIVDPLGENWGLLFSCSSGGACEGYEDLVRAFRWKNGMMTPLATLGGNNAAVGFYSGANSRGQIVGFAETSTQDPKCAPPQVFAWEAVVWGPEGEIHELPPFTGDAVGAAFSINDSGQVVGGSGICALPTFADSIHAVLWQNGSAINLGSFGGVMNNFAWAINNLGQVVGFSDLSGDTTTHAFLWTEENGIQDLGTLAGDFESQAYGVNDKRQIVGQSCDQSGNCRGFLWQNGVMTDLNTLTAPDSLYVVQANGINAAGEIAGIAFDESSGETSAFLAIPCDEAHIDMGCQDAAQSTDGFGERPRVALPESVRNRFRQRSLVGHY
jgi:probable HAF family extracellular repeat protein